MLKLLPVFILALFVGPLPASAQQQAIEPLDPSVQQTQSVVLSRQRVIGTLDEARKIVSPNRFPLCRSMERCNGFLSEGGIDEIRFC
jgi:hypothetical protein